MSLSDPENFDRRAIPKQAHETMWAAKDGWQLRQLDWCQRTSGSRGSVLFMAGRADFFEKYLETFSDFYEQGWNITALDWRGQGGSGRCGPHPHVGHIEDFLVWVNDLAEFFIEWRASHPGPHVVIGHSMGGHLVMRTLVEQKIHPDAVILSAPMLAPAGGGTPEWAAQLIGKFMCAIGRSERRAWKASEKPLEPEVLRQRLLTHDAERYSDEFYWFGVRPEIRLGPASWRWVERAYSSTRKLRNPLAVRKVKTPILILATSVDELVDNALIEITHQLLPHSRLKLFGEECAHEIYREVDVVRNAALQASYDFLDELAPADK